MANDEHRPEGPLDELFPAMRREREALPKQPVHPRVLETPEEGGHALNVITWGDPGGPRALHEAIRQRFEGALLSELSRSAADLREESRTYVRLRWFVFGELGFDPAPAVSAFGLVRVPYDASALRDTMALIRGEANRVELEAPHAPLEVWEVPIRAPEGLRGEKLLALEDGLRDALGETVWGAKPGAFFLRLAALLAAMGDAVPSDASCLAALEAVVGQETPGHVRALPPLVFQALCDAVGVVAVRDYGREVQWAPCEPDEDGFAPPPLLRAKLPDGIVHVPIGLHLLRWCLMPLAPGEVPPSLSDWARDQFGARP